MDLLKEYSIAIKGIRELVKEAQGVESLVNNIDEIYKDRIRALEQERSEKLSIAKQERNNRIDVINAKRDSCTKITAQVARVIEVMKIIKSNPIRHTPEVYTYSSRDEQGNYINPSRKVPFTPVRTLVDDEYSIIQLFIVPNGKPTNKFSLVLRGYSILADLLPNEFKMARGYINRINESTSNLKAIIKDDESEKALLSYLDAMDAKHELKNVRKINEGIPHALNLIKKEYAEAIELLKEVPWQIMYLESQKHYYEHNYSNGVNTPEYAAVKAELKKLRKL